MSTPYRDPWAILGLDRNADDKQIKAAFRALARKYHPDKNKDAENFDEIEKLFADIARAHEAISTAENRTRWLAENEGLTSPFSNSPNTSFPDVETQQAAPASGAGGDQVIRESVQISFADSYKGTQVEIEVEVDDICSLCGGSGAAPGYQPLACDICHGTGQHQIGRTVNICSACQGKGFLVEKPCARCQNGLVTERRAFLVQIPPGVTDGFEIRLDGQRKGRLVEKPIVVSVHIQDSPIFQRNLNDPADLLIDVPISYPEAVLGASIKIPTPERVINLKIPSGTTSGKFFRIKDAGMPRLNSADPNEKGTLYAQTLITVPENISKQELSEIAGLQKYQPKDLRYHLFNENS